MIHAESLGETFQSKRVILRKVNYIHFYLNSQLPEKHRNWLF
ncbi:hypothetical protein SD78_1924 [Bacillus badius]|nr:hypothetical protein SD78_1924 [Bacillus badius]